MAFDEKKFLGKGLNFPIRTDARGQVELITGKKDIEQSIRIIIGTRPGERVMRPTFGCRAHELIFEPRSPSTISLLQEYVYDALRVWEPRIDVLQVDVITDDSNGSALMAKIEYQVKATHDVRSIVYPFFIEDEPEVT
jgi:phage baseplate assembly protein W